MLFSNRPFSNMSGDVQLLQRTGLFQRNARPVSYGRLRRRGSARTSLSPEQCGVSRTGSRRHSRILIPFPNFDRRLSSAAFLSRPVRCVDGRRQQSGLVSRSGLYNKVRSHNSSESQCSKRASKTTPDPRMANAGAGSGQLQISGAAFPWPPA